MSALSPDCQVPSLNYGHSQLDGLPVFRATLADNGWSQSQEGVETSLPFYDEQDAHFALGTQSHDLSAFVAWEMASWASILKLFYGKRYANDEAVIAIYSCFFRKHACPSTKSVWDAEFLHPRIVRLVVHV